MLLWKNSYIYRISSPAYRADKIISRATRHSPSLLYGTRKQSTLDQLGSKVGCEQNTQWTWIVGLTCNQSSSFNQYLAKHLAHNNMYAIETSIDFHGTHDLIFMTILLSARMQRVRRWRKVSSIDACLVNDVIKMTSLFLKIQSLFDELFWERNFHGYVGAFTQMGYFMIKMSAQPR